MNSIHRQDRRLGRIAILLSMLAAVFAGVLIPAQAQTFPVAFPAPTTFATGCAT